jgi:hypothetical protein
VLAAAREDTERLDLLVVLLMLLAKEAVGLWLSLSCFRLRPGRYGRSVVNAVGSGMSR